jgi:hypothetical protein
VPHCADAPHAPDANRKQIAAARSCRISPVTDASRVDLARMRKNHKKLTLALTTIRSLHAVSGGDMIISGTTGHTIDPACHPSVIGQCRSNKSLCPATCLPG